MGVVPHGTVNYFARMHRIPTEPADAVRLVLAGVPRRLRAANLSGRRGRPQAGCMTFFGDRERCGLPGDANAFLIENDGWQFSP